MRGTFSGFVVVLLLGSAISAPAQLRQPRCGGWPPAPGTPGMIIGLAGKACYGRLVTRVGLGVLKDLRVRSIARQGKFRMLNQVEFEYVPGKTQQSMESIEIDLVWNENGADRIESVILRAASAELYEKLGGTANKPPSGETAGRIPSYAPTFGGTATRP